MIASLVVGLGLGLAAEYVISGHLQAVPAVAGVIAGFVAGFYVGDAFVSLAGAMAVRVPALRGELVVTLTYVWSAVVPAMIVIAVTLVSAEVIGR